MFLTPKDHIPFFGGTYFPNEPRHGLPGFKDLLQRVEQYYRQHRVEIEKQNASLVNALDRIYNTPSAMASPTPDAIDKARQGLKQGFDARNGGFGSAPKFPHVTGLELLLRCWAASKHQDSSDRSALHMVIFTLTKMALGGIYDHLGGGFCRYSVDDLWMIPHFEKMLYDNGPLLTLYSEAATATGNELFLRTGLETADWVIREMQSPEGGYHSTLDADSEGEEGKYYVWSSELIKKLLDSDEYPLFARRFGLDRRANFEGHWHLHAFVDIEHLADEFGMHESEVKSRLDEGRQKLFREREKRIRPGRDEKILTSWNGLMIKGMAAAGRYFHKSDYIDSATRALDFVYETMWKNGRLLATYKDGKAHLNAYLDDYAFIIDAIVELLQCRWRSRDLTFACNLADVLLEYFEDHDNGGFYFTSNDHERLIQRLKGYTDESTPSGNGVAAKALARLGYIVGQPDYIDAAERTIKQAAASIHSAPTAHAAILIAYEEQLAPPEILILRGQSQVLKQWHQRCLNDYAPRRITLAIPNDAENLPAALSSKAPQGDAVAYACHGMTCSPPILNLEELDQVLAKTSAVL